MVRFTLARLGLAVAQFGVLASAAFALTALLPGDAAVVVAGEQAGAQEIAAIRQRLGLDEPLWERFTDWIGAVLQGDLGRSLVTGVPITAELGERFAATAILGAGTLALLVPLSLVLGVVCGVREGSRTDRMLSLVTIVLHAVPEFVLGLLLLAAFAVSLAWFPATAAGRSGADLLADPAVLVLPVTVLVARQLGELARQLRIGVAEHNAAEPVSHLRLLGLPEHALLWRHVLPNALAPVAQQLARTVEWLLCGAVIVESLFAVRGLGSGFVEAVENRDIPAVQGYVVVFAAVVVSTNLIADLVARRLAPRRERVR